MEPLIFELPPDSSAPVLPSVEGLPIEALLKLRFGVEMGQVVAFCERFGIVELGLFGSAVRDDFRVGGEDPSDVDLLVVFEGGARRSYPAYLDLREAAERLFGRKVDICQKALIENPYRRAKILRSARVIYAA